MLSTQRRFVLALTFLTGFSGLVYEVTWQKYLANLLGSQAKANALILAVFLGCLSLGYVAFGRWSKFKSPRELIRAYGLAELTIGLWALAFLPLQKVFWAHVGAVDPTSWLALPCELTICLLLIGVPTFLMGGTLPLLTQGLSENINDSSRWHAQVYATNTFGAFMGALAAGFVLLPMLGLKVTLLAVSLINIFAGLLFLRGSKKLLDTKLTATQEPQATPTINTHVIGFLAFLSGFVALSVQNIVIRTTGLVMGSSEYTFSMIVGAYILILAIGAWSASLNGKRALSIGFNLTLVSIGLLLLYYITPRLPIYFYLLRGHFADSMPSFYLYHATTFGIYAAILLLSIGALGRMLPMLFQILNKSEGQLGGSVGYIYGLNTLGCVLGSLVGGYYLLNFLNLDQILKLCVGLTVIAIFFVATFQTTGRLYRGLLFSLGVLTITLTWFLPHWDQTILSAGYFRAHNYGNQDVDPIAFRLPRIVAFKDDPTATVTIVDETDQIRSIYLNGKTDGATVKEDYITTHMVAHVPMLLSQIPISKVAIIGFGTGNTAGVFSIYPEVRQIHVVEISSAVKDFAHFFDFSNHNISKSPKLTWNLDDAFRFLSNDQNRYSLIVSEPSNPWVVGVERVYSQDFYQRVSTRLEPGGLYVQWFHLYEISNPTVGIVFKTFASVFSHVKYFCFANDVILIGRMSEFDAPIALLAQSKFSNPEIESDLKSLGFDTLDSVLTHEIQIRPLSFSNFDAHTLEKPILSYSAEKDFFLKSVADLALFK